MPSTEPGRSRHPSRPKLIGQLTLGECIAIARYAPHMMDEDGRHVDSRALMELIEDMNVCTTCGWPERTHAAVGIHAQALGMCAQFTDRR